MANNRAEVAVAKPVAAGGLLVAPVGTALPSGLGSTLNNAFEGLGYISDDGFVETEDRSVDNINDWGGETIATAQTTFGKTFTFTIVQYLNPEAHRMIRGDANVTTTPANGTHGNRMTVLAKSTPAPHRSIVVDMVLGNGGSIRKVAPDGQFTDIDDSEFKADTATGIGGTVTLYPDEDGVYVYTYTDDGAVELTT